MTIKKTLTPIGKELHKIRIDRDLTSKEMAEEMGVSAATLSGVERGRTKVSGLVRDKILAAYANDETMDKLMEAIRQSQAESDTLKFEMAPLSTEDRQRVLALWEELYDQGNTSPEPAPVAEEEQSEIEMLEGPIEEKEPIEADGDKEPTPGAEDDELDELARELGELED